MRKLIQFLDEHFPDWRNKHSDPYAAADYYEIHVDYASDTSDNYRELDFNEPDYGSLEDGFGNEDYS